MTTGFSINGASISDIHLGHPRTPTKLITSNLDIAFPDNAETAKLDVIFLAGDVFDRMLQVPEAEAYIARAWVYRFLCICAKHGIVVRVLEGTPRHDRRQSKMFEEVIELTGLKIDFKYIDTLQIEHIESLDINVLFIPDEWRHDPAETFEEVKAAMSAKALDKVDFAVMHGCFEFQLPDVESVRRSAHRSENYLPIVRYQIFIGHHHAFSQFEHIVAHGSFDRLIHGEEAPKGHIRFSIRNGHKTITFVENKLAMDYRTVKVHDLSIGEVNELIVSLNLRPGSYIRLSGTIFDMGIRMLRHIRKDFPDYKFTPFVEKKEKKDLVPTRNANYEPVQISQNNVVGKVCDWLTRKNYTEAEIKDCEGLLNEQVNARSSWS